MEGEFWKSKRESDLSGEMGKEVEVKGEWWLWWWKGGKKRGKWRWAKM